ncbi:hypothetical protein B0O99DRAFT_386858 [Bisporella sp. PMI_857]|nr:hypothetical protein B0O99DRAFT_386858 [Bisporella sp. PMI_857]
MDYGSAFSFLMEVENVMCPEIISTFPTTHSQALIQTYLFHNCRAGKESFYSISPAHVIAVLAGITVAGLGKLSEQIYTFGLPFVWVTYTTGTLESADCVLVPLLSSAKSTFMRHLQKRLVYGDFRVVSMVWVPLSTIHRPIFDVLPPFSPHQQPHIRACGKPTRALQIAMNRR